MAFSDDSECGEEPAIAHASLSEVVGPKAVVGDENTREPCPCERLR